MPDATPPKSDSSDAAPRDAAKATQPPVGITRDVVDRRSGLERRQAAANSADANTAAEPADYTGPDRRSAITRTDRRTGLERRRGAGIRREDDRRSAEEGEMTAEQFEFVMAIETYKKVNRKLFPTWTEVLEVIDQLGYKKVETRTLKLDNVPEAPLQKVA